MLNPNAKKWVAALRNPNTKQIKGALETSKGQCVLGVPCRLYADEHPEWSVTTTKGITRFGGEPMWRLPIVVWRWLSLTSPIGVHQNVDGKTVDLMVLNDDGMSLPDLADLIESEPEGLFV